MKKRIISIFIAVAMMVALVPAGMFSVWASDDGPGLDVLLQPFNILQGDRLSRRHLGEDILTPGAESVLAKLNIYRPSGFTGGTDVNFNYFTARSMEQLASSFNTEISTNVNVKANYSGTLFKSNASAKFSSNQSNSFSYANSYESMFSMMSVEKNLGRNSIHMTTYELNRDDVWNRAIDPGVRNLLLNADPDLIFDRFGTHVITNYDFGAIVENTMSVVRTSASSEQSIEQAMGLAIGAGISAKGLTRSFEANIETNISTKERAESVSSSEGFESNISGFIGGGTKGQAPALNAWGDTTVLEDWMDSVQAHNAKTSTDILINNNLGLLGIWELIPFEYAEHRIKLQEAYLRAAQGMHDNFFAEFVYSQISTPPADIPAPVFDETFTIITDESGLRAISGNLAGKYILANDIIVTGTWTPIGTAGTPFTGVVEGNSNTVRGVNYPQGTTNTHLFGVNSGTIRNLGVVSNGSTYRVASVNNGRVENCFINGELEHNLYTEDYLNTVFIPTYNEYYNGNDMIIPSTHRQARINFNGAGINPTANRTITIRSGVEEIRFLGDEQTYNRLNIIVEGDTVVIFDNFKISGHNQRDDAFPALRFNGSNPVLVSFGKENSITGFGRYFDSVNNRAVLEATGNLTILGDTDLTINHNNSASTATSSDNGKAAIYVTKKLDIALDNAALNAIGGDGRNGADGENGPSGHWRDSQTGTNGLPGTDGTLGGYGGTGIYADIVNIMNDSRIAVNGGSGGIGGNGGHGGRGGDGSVDKKGGTGGHGGKGGAGGGGGNGINVNVLNIMNDSQLAVSGGHGGRGGTAGDGGRGGNSGTNIGVFQWGYAGDGNVGGNGGQGGDGGTPLLSTMMLHQSKNSSLAITSGWGMMGGNGGNGGGSGGKNNNRASYGHEARGGHGGDGGFHGNLDIAGGINTIKGQYFGATGGTGGPGAYGNPGNAGASRTAVPNNSFLTYDSSITGALGTANLSMWTKNRINFSGNLSRTESEEYTSTLRYNPGEIFEFSRESMNLSDGGWFDRNKVHIQYNFNTPAEHTVVTVTYFDGGGRYVRYIPVIIEEAKITAIDLIKPAKTQFIGGSDDFNNEGLALGVHTSDGKYKLFIDPSADIQIDIRTFEVTESTPVIATVSHPEFAQEVLETHGANEYEIIIIPSKVDAIRVISPPRHTDYLIPPKLSAEYNANILNTDEILLEKVFNDGSVEPMSVREVKFVPEIFDSVAIEKVTVLFRDDASINTDFDVNVQHDRIIADSAQVMQLPRQNYYEGDRFDSSGFNMRTELQSGFRFLLDESDFAFTPAHSSGLPSWENSIRAMCNFRDMDNNQIFADIPINVFSIVQTDIRITQPSAIKTSYYEGEQFDTTDLEVRPIYDNYDILPEKQGELITNYTISPSRPLLPTDTEIIITSSTFNKSIPVTVTPKTITALNLIQSLSKTDYLEDDTFDPAGMIIEATYNDGEVKQVTDYTITPNRPLEINDTNVTISFGGVSINIPITVAVRPQVESPTANIESGYVTKGSSVTLSTETEDAVIRYTTDGSEPTTTSEIYTGPIVLTSSLTTIKAKAFKAEMKDSETSTFTYLLEDAPMAAVERVVGRVGDYVDVPVVLYNNPGLAQFSLRVSFNNAALELVSSTQGQLGGVTLPNTIAIANANNTGVVAFSWTDADGFDDDLTLFTVRFKIKENLFGFEEIGLSVGLSGVFDVNEQPVDLATISGGIEIPKFIPGDINEDGIVNGADAIYLARYFAEWPGYELDATQLLAADINGDSVINGADGIYLARHFAEWPGYEILSIK